MSNEALYGLGLIAAMVLSIAAGILLVNGLFSKSKEPRDGKN